MFQSKCSTYCSAADKELYCDPHTEFYADCKIKWLLMHLNFFYLISFSYYNFSRLLIITAKKEKKWYVAFVATELEQEGCWCPCAAFSWWNHLLVLWPEQLFLLWSWIWFLLSCFCRPPPFPAVGYLPFFCISVYCKELLQIFFFSKHADSLKFLTALQNVSQCFIQSTPALKAEESICKFLPLTTRPTGNRD